MKRLVVALVLVAGRVALALAQTPAKSPTFDVVSIKPYAGPVPDVIKNAGLLIQAGGRLRGSPVTALTLVETAFRPKEGFLRPDQIVGAPGWVNTARFEFLATANQAMSREALQAEESAMIRAVLEERFKLKAHMEARPIRTYALVKARPDGRLGPAMHPSKVDCEAASREMEEKRKQMTTDAFIRLMAAGQMPCGMRFGRGSIAASDVTLKELASSLGVDRPVSDRSGLEGRFSFELHWAPPVVPSPNGDPSTSPVLSDAPTIFSALEEQLGLKLEKSEAPMDVLVIDQIEPPTPN